MKQIHLNISIKQIYPCLNKKDTLPKNLENRSSNSLVQTKCLNLDSVPKHKNCSIFFFIFTSNTEQKSLYFKKIKRNVKILSHEKGKIILFILKLMRLTFVRTHKMSKIGPNSKTRLMLKLSDKILSFSTNFSKRTRFHVKIPRKKNIYPLSEQKNISISLKIWRK
jgi:hypothetical protein